MNPPPAGALAWSPKPVASGAGAVVFGVPKLNPPPPPKLKAILESEDKRLGLHMIE